MEALQQACGVEVVLMQWFNGSMKGNISTAIGQVIKVEQQQSNGEFNTTT